MDTLYQMWPTNTAAVKSGRRTEQTVIDRFRLSKAAVSFVQLGRSSVIDSTWRHESCWLQQYGLTMDVDIRCSWREQQLTAMIIATMGRRPRASISWTAQRALSDR